MSHRCIFVLIGLVSLVWVLPASADVPGVNKDLAANAALHYWKAFQSMPRPDAETEKIIDAWKEGPPPPAFQKLLDDETSKGWPVSLKQALMQLHRGAKQPRCEWGLDYDQGMDLWLTHLQ